MPRIAISVDFLESIYKLPKKVQKKVSEFTEKFKNTPDSAGLNYEKIHNARDDKFRSLRVDQNYRAIVIKPEKGDIYILAWVDKHDDAYKWAESKKVEINPYTGVLQLITIETRVEGHINEQKIEKEHVNLTFDKLNDNQLLELGLPNELLTKIREVRTEEDLDKLQAFLPEEVYEILLWISMGMELEEASQEVQSRKIEKTIDLNNFNQALEHPDSKRRFVIVEDDEELIKMLNEPLAKWRVFLHPSQEKNAKKHFNGSVRILGGPGTGKTVLVMHRAKHLAKNIYNKKTDRILLTTYTKNLAIDIHHNLKNLCGEEIERIDVIHLHGWVDSFLKRIGSNRNFIKDDTIKQRWDEVFSVLGIPEDGEKFVRDEWNQVIQANGIKTLEEYIKIPRIGRKKSISRSQKAKYWEYFEEYRNLLDLNKEAELIDLVREARLYLEKQGNILPYKSILVDEGQDIHPEEYKLIRQMVTEGENDIFIVGDPHQRIYERQVVLGKCGINIRGRSAKLKINYRTTDEIRKWSLSLLDGCSFDDLDGNLDKLSEYKSLFHGDLPIINNFNNQNEEIHFIVSFIKNQNVPQENICITLRNNNLVEFYKQELEKNGLDCTVLSKEDKNESTGIRIGTMHRVKGLEFPIMIIASVNKGVVPYLPKNIEDEQEKEDYLVKEKSLLFVSATRARDVLLITSYGKQSPLLN